MPEYECAPWSSVKVITSDHLQAITYPPSSFYSETFLQQPPMGNIKVAIVERLPLLRGIIRKLHFGDIANWLL